MIEELRAAITAFETRDMAELVKFHRYVEQDLEKLTDETQVLPFRHYLILICRLVKPVNSSIPSNAGISKIRRLPDEET